MMKNYPFILFILTWSLSGFSQTTECVNQLDTAEVIKIAKKENAWWDKKNWNRKAQHSIYPKVVFDEQNCEWIVYSVKAWQTRKGECEVSGRDCKDKSGCTVTTSITLIIDANTKKVKSKKKRKKKMHNLRVE